MSGNYDIYSQKMSKVIDSLGHEFASIRAGRANPAILDKVNVDYYGAPTPVNQMAAISVSEARNLLITPWDKGVMNDIYKAILAADLGINPTNDGNVIRMSFPPLTEERRRDLTKTISKFGEEAKVSVRNVRRDAIDDYKKMKKASEITEDDLKSAEKDIQALTDKFCKEIDGVVKAKEAEIMEL